MSLPKKPEVVIIGRPNVGKSTLFNRLVGKKLALVDDQPGVTRDRRMGDAVIAGLHFTVVDTAGWEDEHELSLPGRMRKQTEASLAGADAALFVVASPRSTRKSPATCANRKCRWWSSPTRPKATLPKRA
jgi:GTP-binding protein